MEYCISIVIPAYNEAGRLPPYLRAIRAYFSRIGLDNYEVLVVDDGSRDGMADMLIREYGDWDQLRVLRRQFNGGKGAAVREGVLVARGALVLFADADGATPIEDEHRLRASIVDGVDLAVGSRLLRNSDGSQTRRWYRAVMGHLFANLVRSSLSLPIRDTQCGFKMFRRDVAIRLFGPCQEDGYLFDLQILGLAHRLGYRMVEIPVRWTDVPGSRVRLARDSWLMLKGISRIRGSIDVAAMDGKGAT